MQKYRISVNHFIFEQAFLAHDAKDAAEACIFNTKDAYKTALTLAQRAGQAIIEADGRKDYYKAVYTGDLTELLEEQAGATSIVDTEQSTIDAYQEEER